MVVFSIHHIFQMGLAPQDRVLENIETWTRRRGGWRDVSAYCGPDKAPPLILKHNTIRGTMSIYCFSPFVSHLLDS